MEEQTQNTKKDDTINISKSTIWQIVSGVLGILLIISIFTSGFGFGSNSNSPTGGTVTGDTVANNNQPSQPSVINLEIPSFVPYLGSSSAKVSFVEFGDYQCPFCERFFTQAESQLIKNYVETNKMKFYFMDFAFLGPDSTTLSEGAWCADEQGKYYEYHDYIYSNQGQENSGWATPDKVKTMVANIAGLDVEKFGSCLDDKKYESRVKQLTSLGQSAGVQGTPSAVILTDKAYPSSTFSDVTSGAYAQNVVIGKDQKGNTVIFVSGALPYDAFNAVLSKLT